MKDYLIMVKVHGNPADLEIIPTKSKSHAYTLYSRLKTNHPSDTITLLEILEAHKGKSRHATRS